MSQYLHVYIRSLSGDLTEVGCFSRSGYVYQAFDHMPYERIKAVTSNDIDNAIEFLSDLSDKVSNEIKKGENLISAISSFNNSVGEKVDKIYEISADISEATEELDCIENALYTVMVYKDMMDNNRENYMYTEDKSKEIHPEQFMYMGIECYKATLDDIRE